MISSTYAPLKNFSETKNPFTREFKGAQKRDQASLK
jgi:hypothetical protein